MNPSFACVKPGPIADSPFVRDDDPGEAPQERAFTGAVRAGDDGGFAGGEGDREIAEGASPAEANGQPSSFQDGVTHDG